MLVIQNAQYFCGLRKGAIEIAARYAALKKMRRGELIRRYPAPRYLDLTSVPKAELIRTFLEREFAPAQLEAWNGR